MATRVTVRTFLEKKSRGEKITMLTAYDHPTAAIADRSSIDALLIGDSLGMVVQGNDSTLGVTMEQTLYHTRLVSRAAERALVVADMPFLSFQVSAEAALQNAGRLLAEGGAHAVKLEGGRHVANTVSRLVNAGIPVMGHLGLTPQSVNALGGWRVQGRTAAAARVLLEDALLVQDAGAFAIVLELVPAEVAEAISSRLSIPTIGIGSGAGCDGQVLVLHDMVGLSPHPEAPKRHARQFADVGQTIAQAVSEYCAEVRAGTFPGHDNASHLGGEDLRAVLSELADAGAPRTQGSASLDDAEPPLYGGRS